MMKKTFTGIILSIALCAFCLVCKAENSKLKYVNCFVGTAYHGHTFPGACAPFGLVQASPDTGFASWRYCSGYNFEDPKIIRFSQTHLSGTGCSDLGDAAIMPFSDRSKKDGYKSQKDAESASPAYYSVNLTDADCTVEVTAKEHSAFYKITAKADGVKLLLDLQHGVFSDQRKSQYPTISAGANFYAPNCVSGFRTSQMWVERESFFDIKFDRPVISKSEILPKNGETAPKYELDFGLKKGDVLLVKIGISAVSEIGAKNNLAAEISDWDFSKVKSQTEKKWENILSKIDVKGSDVFKQNFYTSLYHLFIQPNNIADCDGTYKGADGKIAQAKCGKYYSTFSTWDTFRAAHSMYVLLSPDDVSDFANSMITHFEARNMLPIWTLWGKENYCMIGVHSIPVLAEAYFKGVKGFDANKALDAAIKTSSQNRRGFDYKQYEKLGYLPFDKSRASVAITLETSYDDACIARLANALNRPEDAARFARRADFYKNLFDPQTGFMRGRDSNGNWRTPFSEFALPSSSDCGKDYIEGNALQYTWHVLQDAEGLMNLYGGKDEFAKRLEALFRQPKEVEGAGHAADVTGLIGQYAHGNEPSHHTIYLLSLAGRKDQAAKLIRQVFDSFYAPKPDGLCGNDDCGQMSAWFIFSALGFYPLDPASCEYILGAPQMQNAKINLPNGKIFEVRVKNFDPKNALVKSVKLNGKLLDSPKIKHSDIINGAILEFEMQQ